MSVFCVSVMGGCASATLNSQCHGWEFCSKLNWICHPVSNIFDHFPWLFGPFFFVCGRFFGTETDPGKLLIPQEYECFGIRATHTNPCTRPLRTTSFFVPVLCRFLMPSHHGMSCHHVMKLCYVMTCHHVVKWHSVMTCPHVMNLHYAMTSHHIMPCHHAMPCHHVMTGHDVMTCHHATP